MRGSSRLNSLRLSLAAGVHAAWSRRFTCRLGCNSRCVNALERRLHSTIRRGCYNGFWFSPEREALQELVTETQRDVSGVIRLKLYRATLSSPVARVRRVSTIQESRPWKATNHRTIKTTRPALFASTHCGLSCEPRCKINPLREINQCEQART